MKSKFLFYLAFIVFAVNALNASAQTKKIKVACVGNSITAGAGLKKEDAYPVVLQKLLGDSLYDVKNYGISGRTLLKKGDHPYWIEQKYKDVLAWQPDVVVIKLGTNDTKPQNWKFKDDFIADYIEFVNSFKALASHPKIYVCYPVKIFPNKMNIRDSVLIAEMKDDVKKVKRKTGSKLIDLYTPFELHPEFFPDGVHPNKPGAALLAELIYNAIK